MPPSDRYHTILLFGAPGVGKGTQGKLLGKIPGLYHLATGDIFRSLNRESDLGRQFYEYSSRGELVPDDLTIQLWLAHMQGLIAQRMFSPLERLADPRRHAAHDRAGRGARRFTSTCSRSCTSRLPNVDEMVVRMKRPRDSREPARTTPTKSVIRPPLRGVHAGKRGRCARITIRKLIAEVNGVGTPAHVLMNILQVIVPIYDTRFTNPLAG